jgi:hypothetical protein
MNMKPVIAVALGAMLLGAMLLGAGCSAPSSRSYRPSSEPVPAKGLLTWHLTHEWLKAAEKIRLKEGVIYYQGTAESASGEGELWIGTIRGDILYLMPDRAMVTAAGTLTVQRNGAIRMAGPTETSLAKAGEEPAWSGLLGR